MNNHYYLLDRLYQSHYSRPHESVVTSSHWRSVGWQSVRKAPNGYDLVGSGFGSRRSQTLLNWLMRWPSSHMTEKLLEDHKCSDDILDAGRDISRRHGRLFDFDCARQVLTVNLLRQELGSFYPGIQTTFNGSVVIIGDGYGYLGSLFKSVFQNARIIEVNIGRTLFFDAYYSLKAFPCAEHHLLQSNEQVSRDADFTYVEAEHVAILRRLDANLFINIASMQEMNPPIIQMYFDLMHGSLVSPAYFYCCNREEKRLPDGTVIRFEDYGWRDHDVTLLDELCPWHQAYPQSLPPRWRPFDGPIRHRLIRLAGDAGA